MSKITLEVLDERLGNLIKDNGEEHKKILEQTTKTNGKVADVSKIQERMIGALIVMNVVFVPIFVAIIIEWILKAIFK